jgi:integrase
MDNEKILLNASNYMKLRGFTKATKKNYLYYISKYLIYLNKISFNLGDVSAKEYLLYLNNKKLSTNTIRLASSSILFLLKDVLGYKITYLDIPKPKKHKILPKVLSKEEILLILNNIKNKKHKLMISFLYSSGIRLSELINLKRNEVDVNRNIIFIKSGKGSKDRITILSKKIKNQLLSYLIETKFNTNYLFETNRGKKYLHTC